MKCIKKKNIIRRVSDSKAHKMIDTAGWKFCSKSEYKKSKEEKK